MKSAFSFASTMIRPYVKLQKLDVMVKLADSSNVDQLLHELKEYATEVDILFARSVVRSIGKVAFNVNSAVDRCITTLLEIVASQVPYVVQEAVHCLSRCPSHIQLVR